MWTLVARVAKMEMQQRVNCRIKCLVAHTQSTHTPGPWLAQIKRWGTRLKRGGTTPFLPLPSFPSPCPPPPFNGGPGVQPPEKIFKPQMLVDDF
jgi:hypothetical protein